MGFLSRYTGVDQLDLGDGYHVTLLQHLPGEEQEAAEAAKVKAIATVSDDEGEQRSVEVATSTDMARYTTLLLNAAIVSWNLTDERDVPLPLGTPDERLASIRRLHSGVRARLREHVEANIKRAKQSTEDQQTFRGAGHGSGPDGEGRPAGGSGGATPGSLLDPTRRHGG